MTHSSATAVLTVDERAQLHALADILIPQTETMPPLRDVDADGGWLDRACVARGDLLPALRAALLDLAGAADLTAALRGLHGADRDTFDVVATVVAGAYYMVPRAVSYTTSPSPRD